MKLRKLPLIAALVALALLVLIWARVEGPLREPEAALNDFLGAEQRAEDQLTDPLVLAGSRVVPLVVAAVQDPEMPLRRYAISFLGCSRAASAIETLERILHIEAEVDYFRADALDALWLIEPNRGVRLASKFQSEEGFLGDQASRLLAGPPHIYCRSWVDALLHRHG